MRIAFLGLGSMGLPMARNLAASEHDVVVWNRSAEKASALEGVAHAASPAAAAADADLVITMLSDDAAVEAVTLGPDGLAATLPHGAVHACMTTISAAQSRRLDAAHRERSQRYVAAPVFGRPEAASRKLLWVIAGGEWDAVEACRPAFDALGQGVIAAGADPAQANVLKLAGNFLLASALEAMAEAFTLVRAHGIDTRVFLDTIATRLFRSPIYENYGGMIESSRFEPAGFALKHGLKDVRFALQSADGAGVPMPFASVLHDRFLTAVAQGWGDSDWSTLGRLAARDSGERKG